MKHLLRRGDALYLNLPIPRPLRGYYLSRTGKPATHIREALHTGDLAKANREKHRRIAYWMADFARMEREKAGETPSDVREVHEFRKLLRDETDEDARELLELAASDHADKIAEDAGIKKAKAWFQFATDTTTPTLLQAFDEWMKESDLTEQTRQHYGMTLKEFLRVVELGDALPAQITDEQARRYVRWLNTEAQSRRRGPMGYKTKYGRVTALSSLWKDHLQRNGYVPQGRNPWKGHKITGKKKANVNGDEMKRPHTEGEMLRLINGSELGKSAKYPKRTIIELYALAWYTGARIGEICSRTLGDVEALPTGGYVLHIRQSKTPAGVRSIPIVHPIPVAVLRRRIDKRTDPKAQLFVEFQPGGPDKKLSWYPVKRMGRYRDLAGLTEQTDLHSTRRDLITLLEAFEVYPLWIQRYVGHLPEGVTFGTYGKVTPASLVAVAKAITYPAPIEAALRTALGL